MVSRSKTAAENLERIPDGADLSVEKTEPATQLFNFPRLDRTT